MKMTRYDLWEEEQLWYLESDVFQENNLVQELYSENEASSEDEDTIDISPTGSSVFVPSKEQTKLWKSCLKRK